MRIATALAVCCLSTAAHAGWKVESIKDRLTDQAAKFATVTAKSDDMGITARLQIYCLGMRGDTSPVVSLETNASFSPGRMGLRYRFDNDEPEPRYMPVNSSGNGMSLWVQPKTFFGKRRLRVELQPNRARNLFFEFDVTGAEQAIRGLGCRRLDALDE